MKGGIPLLVLFLPTIATVSITLHNIPYSTPPDPTLLIPPLPRLAVRKRSIVSLSLLVVSCAPATFSRLMEHLHTHLTDSVASVATASPQQASIVRTYIQCVAAIA